MPAPPPSEAELLALAERALAHAGGDGAQATAAWERTLSSGASGAAEETVLAIEVVVLAGGRAGVARSEATDEDSLARLGEQAVAAAAGGEPWSLPEPAAGRAHQGYDPLVAGIDPGELAARGGAWAAGAARTAIVSTRGVRSFEQRSFASLRSGPLSAAAITFAGIDTAALDIGAAALPSGEPLVAPPADPVPVILGPDAVAAVLDGLRSELCDGGVPAGRLGTRVAASSVNLSDSPRYGATLPRSFDAAGIPRQPVPLIQDGVAHRVVSAATGHRARAGSDAALPAHLVLVGGGVATEDELLAPVELGLHLASLDAGHLVEGGQRTRPVDLSGLRIDPLAVLAGTQALTARQRTIAVGTAARTVGATVCPSLRTSGGISFG